MVTITNKLGQRVEVEGADPYTLEYTLDQIRQYTHTWSQHVYAHSDFKDLTKYCTHIVEQRLAIMWDSGFNNWAFNISEIKDKAIQFVMIEDWFELVSETDKVTLVLGGWK